MMEISQIKIGMLWTLLYFNSIAMGFIPLYRRDEIYRVNNGIRDISLTLTSQSIFDTTTRLCSSNMANDVNKDDKKDKEKIENDNGNVTENDKKSLDVTLSNIVAMSDTNIKSNQVK